MGTTVDYIANVIWIDDKENDEILDNAAEAGLYLEHYYYVDAGMAALQNPDRQWHAVIFDAKCKIHGENEIDDLDALSEGIARLREVAPDMPWFVLTAGDFEGEGAIKHIVGNRERRPWDANDKRFYTKLGEQPQLWTDIKETLKDMPLYNTWLKYHSILAFYTNPDLVSLLDQYENGGESFDRDDHILVLFRLILDSIFARFNQCGLLSTHFSGTNLAECSKQLGARQMEEIVPRYIQRSLHMAVECCNPGAHRCPDDSTNEENPIHELIRQGDAPYLNRSIMLCLLNILNWCKTLPQDEEGIEKLQQTVEYINSNSK